MKVFIGIVKFRLFKTWLHLQSGQFKQNGFPLNIVELICMPPLKKDYCIVSNAICLFCKTGGKDSKTQYRLREKICFFLSFFLDLHPQTILN